MQIQILLVIVFIATVLRASQAQECPFNNIKEDDESMKSRVRQGFDPREVCSDRLSNSVRVEWAWLGALESTSVVLKARLSCVIQAPESVVVLVQDVQFNRSRWYSAERVGKFGMATLILNNLEPLHSYQYAVWVINKKADESTPSPTSIVGFFNTPGPIGEPYSFDFGFASCADNHSNSVIFDVIREKTPLLFLHTGDLHYGNIEVNDPSLFHGMYDQVMGNPRQAKFFRNVPIAYMFDDHDYGPNNGHEGSLSRESSLAAYMEAVPYYPLPAYTSGAMRTAKRKKKPSVFQAFTIGRVRIILTDTSSSKRVTKGDKSALGEEQLAWFMKELLESSKSHILLIWVTTMPWLTGHSKWGEFHLERDKIVQFLEQHDRVQERLIVLGGDAHMLAVDDGENSPGKIPVFQAAALDAKPTCKGGPYSHGIYPGRGQYGWLQVRDDGGLGKDGTPNVGCVNFKGLRVNSRTAVETLLLQYDTCDPAKRSPRRPYVPSPVLVEKVWKKFKKAIPDEAMVFFDSFTMSFGMICVEFAYFSAAALVVWRLIS